MKGGMFFKVRDRELPWTHDTHQRVLIILSLKHASDPALDFLREAIFGLEVFHHMD